jgi:hypothetical protein
MLKLPCVFGKIGESEFGVFPNHNCSCSYDPALMPNLYSQVRIPLTAATLFVTASNAKVAFFVVLFLFVSTIANRAQNLYVIERDDVYEAGSWGFIDSEGKMQIEPAFWDADNFFDGLAAIHKAGRATSIRPAK